MTEKESGKNYLEVGFNGNGEVVVNLPCDMTGHIIFSPEQARGLASVLNRQANLAEEVPAIVFIEVSADTDPPIDLDEDNP